MDKVLPLIERLDLREDEREQTIKRVSELIYVYQNQLYNQSNIQRFFKEWREIANRVKKGREMLREKHARPMFDLYILLLEMLGIYELFFKSALNEERYYRALESIESILNI